MKLVLPLLTLLGTVSLLLVACSVPPGAVDHLAAATELAGQSRGEALRGEVVAQKETRQASVYLTANAPTAPPTPIPTPTPTSTLTPVPPTATPAPTMTPRPTVTPIPTVTPQTQSAGGGNSSTILLVAGVMVVLVVVLVASLVRDYGRQP